MVLEKALQNMVTKRKIYTQYQKGTGETSWAYDEEGDLGKFKGKMEGKN